MAVSLNVAAKGGAGFPGIRIIIQNTKASSRRIQED